MHWIQKIQKDGDRFSAVYVDKAGVTTVSSLRDAKRLFESSGYRTALVSNASLATMRITDAKEYLDAFDFPADNSENHKVYCLEHDGKRILIPAVVLLVALVSRLAMVGDLLLEPTSFDRLITLLPSNDGLLAPHFWPKFGQASALKSTGARARFQWLAAYPSARRMWTSVYQNALDGRLALIPPNATVNAGLTGRRYEGTIFVTRMSIHTLRADEQPFPYAESRVPAEFLFSPGTTAKQAAMRTHSTASHLVISAEIPIGPSGWRTTNDEWDWILKEMKHEGFSTRPHAKSTLDGVLEKLGVGVSWNSMGPGWRTLATAYFRWGKSGKWAVFMKVLKACRQQTC